MKIAAYLRSNDSRTNDRVHHFAAALGAELTYRDRPVECDLAIQAGFQISPAMKDAMDRDVPFIILENPVWGKEEGNYVFSYNGLARGGTVPNCDELPFRFHPPLYSWKDWEGGQTTIFGQVENDKALRGADIYRWVEGCEEVLPRAVFRPHPVTLSRPDQANQESFEETLKKTHLAITYTSTVGSQAVIAGIPTIACHEGSLAWDVSSHSLSEAPVTPDRELWIHRLAYRHINLNEAVPVEYILSGYDEARANAEAGKYDNMSNGRPQ